MIALILVLIPFLISVLISNASNARFSFVVLSDTQFYSETYPEIFDCQTQWIVDNEIGLNIEYVAHLGDIVQDWNEDLQWQNANSSMSILESATIPFGILAGNHDNDHGRHHTFYSKYFGTARFEGKYWYGGNYSNNIHHYDLLDIDGYKFLILFISFDQSQDMPWDWFESVLKKYSDRFAIIVTHAYLDESGNYAEYSKFGATDIYDNLALPFDNVHLILCGHTYIKNDTILYNQKKIGERTMHEILQDYQFEPRGGNGWLRILIFHADEDIMEIKTYSPYLNQSGAEFNITAPISEYYGNNRTIAVNDPEYYRGSKTIAVISLVLITIIAAVISFNMRSTSRKESALK